MEETSILTLPEEILTKICSFLYAAQLSSLMLVSRSWNTIAGDPLLWSKFPLTLNRRRFQNFNKIKSLRRFSCIKRLEISNGMRDAELIQVMNFIRSHPEMKHLTMASCEPDSVRETFAETLATLETIALVRGGFDKHLMSLLFNKMMEDTNIKKFALGNQGPAYIDPRLFAMSLNKIEEVELAWTRTSHLHIEEFFSMMNKSTTNIKKFSWHGFPEELTSLNPVVFGQSLSKLNSCSLHYLGYSCDESVHEGMDELFKCCSRKTNLKELRLIDTGVQSVDPIIFADVVNKIEKVTLIHTKLSELQQTKMLEVLASGKSKLKVLNLRFNDMSGVNPDTLAEAINNLEHVKIPHTDLTIEQAEKVLLRCIEKTSLKKLDIGNNDNIYFVKNIQNILESVKTRIGHFRFCKCFMKLSMWNFCTCKNCKVVFCESCEKGANEINGETCSSCQSKQLGDFNRLQVQLGDI